MRALVAVMGRAERQGVKLLLDAQRDIQVVAETGERSRAVALAAARKPDVMVVDLLLPGVELLKFLYEISARNPRTRVVILNTPPGAANIARAPVASSLLQAVRDSAKRRDTVRIPFPLAVIDAHEPPPRGPRFELFERLTAREQEVVLLTTRGLSSSETARELGISPRTVEAHRSHAMRKLGLHRRAELVRYAFARGILDSDRD